LTLASSLPLRHHPVRSSGMGGGGIRRVVNALLTQLDALKNYPNVMVLTTTNITQAVDLAFVCVVLPASRLVPLKCAAAMACLFISGGCSPIISHRDRADLKLYIGPPNTHARYEIMRSCLVELQRVGIIHQVRGLPVDTKKTCSQPRSVGVPAAAPPPTRAGGVGAARVHRAAAHVGCTRGGKGGVSASQPSCDGRGAG
jgi:hypothetical protein